MEVFLKLWRKRNTEIENVEAWLYRVALRTGLDELRSRNRRAHYERLFGRVHTNAGPATPEQIHRGTEEQQRVRAVLGSMDGRQAEILLLRSDGRSYDEIASLLGLKASSMGTLLSRAQQAFRKE